MAWFYVLLADLFEIAWPFVLKWSAPLSRWAPLFVVIICAVPANYLLAEAVKRLPAATVYATFVGIGTAGTAIVGMVFFGESNEHRPRLFPGADPPGTRRSEAFFERDRVTGNVAWFLGSSGYWSKSAGCPVDQTSTPGGKTAIQLV